MTVVSEPYSKIIKKSNKWDLLKFSQKYKSTQDLFSKSCSKKVANSQKKT